MRAALFLAAALLPAIPAAAAVRDYPARGFDAVELKSAADVTITQGPHFSVHAEGDARLLQRLTADVRGDTLVLGWIEGGPVQGAHDLHVAITMPRVAGAAISGAGTITVANADAPQFSGVVGGTGTLRIRQLRALGTRLEMSGTGQIVVAGTTKELSATVSGVGSIDAANLPAAKGAFDMSGTGHISARVDGEAAVALSGMGSVVVAGNVHCAVRKSGLGSVRCGK